MAARRFEVNNCSAVDAAVTVKHAIPLLASPLRWCKEGNNALSQLIHIFIGAPTVRPSVTAGSLHEVVDLPNNYMHIGAEGSW